MDIHLLSNDFACVEAFRKHFGELPEVSVHYEDFCAFMQTHRVSCIVSPANAFGIMDGGYDEAITAYFGVQLQERVQSYIKEHYYGEQPVGTSFIIDAGRDGQTLIHTPTMRTPSVIREPLVIYQAMRTTLMCAIENGVESILIPAFGAATGNVHPLKVSRLMRKAYDQIMNPDLSFDWHKILSDVLY